MPADTWAEQAAAAIVVDRQVVRANDSRTSYPAYRAVAGELGALVAQVAEMAEHEPHQLVATCDYLHGLLGREPLRSNPMWEPQRVVLGLFLLGLSSALARLEVITAEEREALRPAYHVAAGEQVRAAFDETYIPPSDDESQPQDEEEEDDPVEPPVTPPAELEDDDPARYL